MPSPGPYHVAFIEPTASNTEHLRQLLEFEGIAVVLIGPDDLHRLPELRVDLVVLNQIRLRSSTLAIAGSVGRGHHPRPLTLALVAQGDELSGVELVERGVDAYVVTPCGSREFVARVRALLRRTRMAADAGPGLTSAAAALALTVMDLDIDPSRRRVRLCGRDLRLTEQEFQLLYFLAGHPGRVFDRQALLDAVWGNETFVTARSVDALVKRVRQQLRAVGRSHACLETVRGVGYRLTDAPASAARSAA